MIDEQSSASGHDYASDRSAIGTGYVPYLLVFKPLGLIYEVGLRFKFKPPGAYKRNVLILHGMC